MLAVVVAPHGFTTARVSEASIVPRASHRRITPAACLGRVLGAEPQVRCRCLRLSQLLIQLRVAPPSPNRAWPFPRHTALRWRPCVSSAIAHHVRFPLQGRPPGLLRLVRGFPTLPGEASLSRLLSVLRHPRLAPVGDPTFRHDGTSEQPT